MTPARARSRRLVPILLILAGMGLGRFFGFGVAQPPVGSPPPVPPMGGTPAPPTLDLSAVAEDGHRAQISLVVEAMDRTGSPPDGVAQGGRRGGRKGVFQNAEGHLPRRAPDYWIESDVWPKTGPRDAERLIFGRGREVYWTRDHYETFMRLR